MSDLIYLVVTVAFFAAAAGLVGLCERIIGRDDPTAVVVEPATDPAVAPGPPPSDADLTAVR